MRVAAVLASRARAPVLGTARVVGAAHQALLAVVSVQAALVQRAARAAGVSARMGLHALEGAALRIPLAALVAELAVECWRDTQKRRGYS